VKSHTKRSKSKLQYSLEVLMITLNERLVCLQSSPANKQEAIRQAGQLLVDNGNIDPGYVTSMLSREKVSNTYLKNGISIPHGMPQDRNLIKQTGISVVQVPKGVTWNPGETVKLVVGIAANSNEHLEALRRLTRLLGDQEQIARLTQTTDPRDIIEALTGERPAATLYFVRLIVLRAQHMVKKWRGHDMELHHF
jgi:mannitol/fructose-specific phosphotransferase system IIA component